MPGLTPRAMMGYLPGDVNGTGLVTAADISALKARLSQPVTANSVVFDSNASGTLDSADLSAMKARAGLTLQ